jgi:hypothetical protein
MSGRNECHGSARRSPLVPPRLSLLTLTFVVLDGNINDPAALGVRKCHQYETRSSDHN